MIKKTTMEDIREFPTSLTMKTKFYDLSVLVDRRTNFFGTVHMKFSWVDRHGNKGEFGGYYTPRLDLIKEAAWRGMFPFQFGSGQGDFWRYGCRELTAPELVKVGEKKVHDMPIVPIILDGVA